MTTKRICRLLGSAVVCVLVSPLIVVADGRKNPRDFPANTLCPINLGWAVDPVTGEIFPPPAQPIRPPALTFTAAGPAAEIALVSCDRGLTDDHPDGLDLWIRDFAVVRRDVYESHQVLGTYPEFSCYLPRDGEGDTPTIRKVGSTFSTSVAPAVLPLTPKLPFFDDFSRPAVSRLKWRLDGAEFKTVESNDPRLSSALVGTALVLARVPADPNQNSCSRASVVVRHLVKGQSYVVDFQWESKGIVTAPEIEMLTFVDTQP